MADKVTFGQAQDGQTIRITQIEETYGTGEFTVIAVSTGTDARGRKYIVAEEMGVGDDGTEAREIADRVLRQADSTLREIIMQEGTESNPGACGDPDCCGDNYTTYPSVEITFYPNGVY